jgi:hypothetical protein
LFNKAIGSENCVGVLGAIGAKMRPGGFVAINCFNDPYSSAPISIRGTRTIFQTAI